MDVGGAGNRGPIPRSGSADDAHKTDDKGQMGVAGPKITKEDGLTLIKDGGNGNRTSKTPLGERETTFTYDMGGHDWEPTVPDGEDDVFFFASDNTEVMKRAPNTLFSGLDVSSSDKVVQSQADEAATSLTKNAFSRKFQKAGAAIIRGFKAFVKTFKPGADVAKSFERTVVALANDKISQDPENVALANKVAEELAEAMEENPAEIITEAQTRGLNKVVSDLKATVKVATNKKLKMEIKVQLLQNAEKFTALQGMGLKTRETMINAALVAAKLGNAGKGNVGDLQGRGYLIGKIPEMKFEMLEAILGMTPDQAITTLERNRRLKPTNFGSVLREQLSEDAMEDIAGLFDGNEVEVQKEPLPLGHYGKIDVDDAKKRPQVSKDIAQAAAGYGSDDAGQLKTNMQRLRSDVAARGIARRKAERNARREKESEEALDGLENLFKEETTTVIPPAPLTPTSSEPVRGGLLASNALRRAKARLEGRTPAQQHDIDTELQKYADAKQIVIENGGVAPTFLKEMEELKAQLTKHLEGIGASKEEAALLYKGILVSAKLAAWTDEESSREVTLLGGVLGKYKNSITNATAVIHMDDLEFVKDMLLNNVFVTSSDFQYVLNGLGDLGTIGGDKE